jgi:hypothetical protein
MGFISKLLFPIRLLSGTESLKKYSNNIFTHLTNFESAFNSSHTQLVNRINTLEQAHHETVEKFNKTIYELTNELSILKTYLKNYSYTSDIYKNNTPAIEILSRITDIDKTLPLLINSKFESLLESLISNKKYETMLDLTGESGFGFSISNKFNFKCISLISSDNLYKNYCSFRQSNFDIKIIKNSELIELRPSSFQLAVVAPSASNFDLNDLQNKIFLAARYLKDKGIIILKLPMTFKINQSKFNFEIKNVNLISDENNLEYLQVLEITNSNVTSPNIRENIL